MNRNEAENISRKVVDIMENERISRNISKAQIAKKTGISRTALILIVNHKNSPTLRTLLMIADAIGVDLEEILRKAK